jgi:hypothetical protein
MTYNQVTILPYCESISDEKKFFADNTDFLPGSTDALFPCIYQQKVMTYFLYI